MIKINIHFKCCEKLLIISLKQLFLREHKRESRGKKEASCLFFYQLYFHLTYILGENHNSYS